MVVLGSLQSWKAELEPYSKGLGKSSELTQVDFLPTVALLRCFTKKKILPTWENIGIPTINLGYFRQFVGTFQK